MAENWTNELLDRMRQAGDPLGDEAIAEIYQLGQQDQVRQALTTFDSNEGPVPIGLPPALERYFTKSAALPSWTDPQQIQRGHLLLGRYQPQISSVLLCASLPLCYGCADGAQVLYKSQRLTSGVYRRLMETSQFVVDVLDDGGLGQGGKGIRSAQKIRLLHATMRYHLSRKDDWNQAWGMPINQEDLAGTLMTFSVVIPRGLARLGIELEPADRDAFFHVWRVVGHIMGVAEDLNPAAFDDGAVLCDAIIARQQRKSEAGTVLTKGVLDFLHEVLPGPAFAGVGPTLIRHLIGDDAADIVDVPPADLTEIGLQLGSLADLGFGAATDAVPIAAKISGELGIALFKQGLLLTNNGRRYQWQVPTGLTPTAVSK